MTTKEYVDKTIELIKKQNNLFIELNEVTNEIKKLTTKN